MKVLLSGQNIAYLISGMENVYITFKPKVIAFVIIFAIPAPVMPKFILFGEIKI